MSRTLKIIAAALWILLAASAFTAHAADDLKTLIDGLGTAKLSEMEEKVKTLAATGDPKVVPLLEALGEGELYARKSDSAVFITKGSGATPTLVDPMTGQEVGEEAKGALTKIKVNNALRRTIRTALGGLTLLSPDKAVRLSAARSILKNPAGQSLDMVESVLAKEADPAIKAALGQARAAVLLSADRPIEEKRMAVETIRDTGGRDALILLSTVLLAAPDELKPDIQAAIDSLNSSAELWNGAQNIWYGISLGSVLLLAAIGLAITFGVMGIINMAHGEMVMLGAYTTYVVQDVIRESYPGAFDYSLAIALPMAFLVTAAFGLAIERLVIKYLYGRPLETLLATWGISLILQQTVRSIFGPTNQEVGNPSWMSGAFDLGGLNITWNRMWIIVFSLAVFAALLFILKKTPMGLQMRAVTQNRRMASSMGIRTPWVDAATFALGSGIAGMAGVALSQIENVSPNLGQGYIIDSFMVVVFGGVGNLWGTLVGAFSLGILNKFLEPYAGAVLGKIAVLVLIILFIQKRPRGLFALKGRAVEA
jgi:urea transport system permease protein